MLSIIDVKIQLMKEYGKLDVPVYKTEHAAGVDLQAAVDMLIKAGEKALVPTGIKMAIPTGYEAQIRPRSGLALKEGIIIPNSPGTIDADYRGEVKIIMWNISKEDFKIQKGERIAQLVVVPVVMASFCVVDELDVTNRNEGGFGHTGR